MISHDVAECVTMSDKVIVLSNRPSIIKKIIDIKLDKKNLPTINRQDKNFNNYYNLIWKEIDN